MKKCFFCLAFAIIIIFQNITVIYADESQIKIYNHTENLKAIDNVVEIKEDYGQMSGGNLFHRFEEFSVPVDQTAKFTCKPESSIKNVINRVTGGNVSEIYGTILSEIEGANFYFLNPAGIIFGKEASINVPGSFHASTADYLRIDGVKFDADELPSGSNLIVDDQVAFGFLDHNVYGSIQVQGYGEFKEADWNEDTSIIEMKNGKTISLIGGDVEFENGSYFYDDQNNITILESITARGGRINLASVISSGEVIMDQTNGMEITTIDADKLGTISLSDRTTLSIDNTSTEGTDYLGEGASISIKANLVELNNSRLISNNYSNKNGGSIDIQGNTILIENDSYISVDVLKSTGTNGGTGNAGNIKIGGLDGTTADSIRLQRSIISAGTKSEHVNAGKAGDVDLNARVISLLSAYKISDQGYQKIQEEIKNPQVLAVLEDLKDMNFSQDLDILSTLQSRLTTEQLKSLTPEQLNTIVNGLENRGSSITANVEGTGMGGYINLKAIETINILGKSNISANALSSGASVASDVQINLSAKMITVSGYVEGGNIASQTTGNRNGGKITLMAGETIDILNFASINTDATSDGSAGSILLNAPKISLLKGGMVQSSSADKGNAGNIIFRAIDGTVRISGADTDGDASSIRNRAMGTGNADAAGNGGEVLIYADNIHLDSGAFIGSETYGGGDGGLVRLVAQDSIHFQGTDNAGYASKIYATSNKLEGVPKDVGKSGNIELEADQIILEDGAGVTASTLGPGEGGTVDVKARYVELIGGNPNGENEDGFSSGFFARSEGQGTVAGDADKIKVEADELIIRDGAVISNSTLGAGNGGELELVIDKQLTVSGKASQPLASNNRVSQKNYQLLYTPELDFQSGVFSSSENPEPYAGDAGTVKIFSPSISLDNEATISTSTKGAGNAGNVELTVKNLFLKNGATLSSATLSKSNIHNFFVEKYSDLPTDASVGDIGIVKNDETSATYYYYDDSSGSGKWDESTIKEIPKYAFRVFNVESEKERNDMIASIGDIAILDDQWYYYKNGWNDGTEELTDSKIPAILDKIGVINNVYKQGDISQIVYKDKTVTLTTKNGSDWLEINSVFDFTEYKTASGLNLDNTNMLAMKDDETKLVERYYSDDSQWVKLQTAGDAGIVKVLKNDQLTMENLNTQISTATSGGGNAGEIEIYSQQINMKKAASIASSSNALGESGDAGTIVIHSNTISLIDENTTINTSTSGQGVAGNIQLNVSDLNLDKKASVSSASNSIGIGGDAGLIMIGKTIIENTDSKTKVDTPWLITPSDKIYLTNESTISTSSAGAGKAGNVKLNSKQIDIIQSASISSANSSIADIIYKVITLNDRDALPTQTGMVVEVADDGTGSAQTYIYTGQDWESKSSLKLNRADNMTQLNALNASPGDVAKVADAGDGYSKNFIFNGTNWVPIESDKTVQVYVEAPTNPEKGDILVSGSTLQVYENGSWQTTQWDPDYARNYQVSDKNNIPQEHLDDRDRANENGENYIRINDKWEEVSKAGDAGKIDIVAENEVFLSTNGSLNTEAISSGGGQISIQGKESLYLFDGLITASVQKGFGAGGDITTRSKSVLMNHSGIEANAVEGDGGAIFITTEQYIKSDDSYVTATSERGNDGTVKIDAPKVDISKGLVVLPTNFLDATRWVKTPCALRSGESVSRLILEGRDAVPTSLIDWQPSPPVDLSKTKKSDKKKKSTQLNRPTLLNTTDNVAMKANSTLY